MRVTVDMKVLGGIASGENLTGSCYLTTIKRGKRTTRILTDVGLFQCGFKDFVENNLAIFKEVDVSSIDYIFLTHAHIDHVGRLPLFVRKGFRGRVICTKPTSNLLPVMLLDSAKIQMQNARSQDKRNKRVSENQKKDKSNGHGKGGYRGGRSGCAGYRGEYKKQKKCVIKKTQPLFTVKDAEDCLASVKNEGFDYGRSIKLNTGIHLEFCETGHVLGGALGVISITRNNAPDFKLAFAGDLGRKDGIILPAPQMPKSKINYLMIESTYGDRIHPERQQEINKLFSLVSEAIKQKHRIIIPSFALERAQEIIYLLSCAIHEGKISSIPIYLDAPMASKITAVYARHWSSPMFKGQDVLPFNPFVVDDNSFLKVITGELDSVNLSKLPGPYIVIAGSGMCNAGRVRNHLRCGLPRHDTTVCLVGYMAKDTLGRKLKEGSRTINMNDGKIVVRAKIVSFDSLSAHADSCYLTEYTNAVTDNDSRILIVHGEKESGLALKKSLLDSPGRNWRGKISIPKLNEEIKIL